MPRSALVYLVEMQEACQFLLDLTATMTLESYLQNRTARLAAERCFITLAEAMKQLHHHHPALSSTFAERPGIVAFRNVIVHQYWAVDSEEVWSVLISKFPLSKLKSTVPSSPSEDSRVVGKSRYHSAMPIITPFLWFNDNAGEAADFYLALFPNARRLSEVRSKGVGPWPEGKIATISIELEGQHVTFLNGGPAHQLSEAFSFTLQCQDQAEIDRYWVAFLDAGGRELACGWVKDHFGVCWQVVPENIGQLINNPGGMAAMMTMKKLDIAALKDAATLKT